MLDKKGAVSFRNLTKKIHNIDMEIYECHECGRWHLTSIEKHHQFRHTAHPRREKNGS